MNNSDSPQTRRPKNVPIGNKLANENLWQRPVYKTGDGDYKYFTRPGSMAPYKLPSRGLT